MKGEGRLRFVDYIGALFVLHLFVCVYACVVSLRRGVSIRLESNGEIHDDGFVEEQIVTNPEIVWKVREASLS